MSGGGVAFHIPVIGGGELMWPNVLFLNKRLQRKENEDEAALKRKNNVEVSVICHHI